MQHTQPLRPYERLKKQYRVEYVAINNDEVKNFHNVNRI